MKKKIILILLACVIMLAFAACDDKKTPSLVIEGKTATTITVTAVEGAEYSKDGGIKWQDENVFDGLAPATTYSITIRMKATEGKDASKMATAVQITTLDKGTQAAPTLKVTKTATTITVEAVTGAEYRIGTGNWQSVNTFEGLTPATDYTVAIRLKETAELAASPATEETVKTNPATILNAPTNFTLDEDADEFKWTASANATKYIVTVVVDKMGSGNETEGTLIRLLSDNYEIEVEGTSLPVSRLPYDCDLKITVRAAHTSAEYADSADTAVLEINRGSVFDDAHIELAVLAAADIRYYAKVQLKHDLVIPSHKGSLNIISQNQAIAAYAELFSGTSDRQQYLSDTIGNDLIFAFYEQGIELTPSNVFAKNKFWDGYMYETAEDGSYTKLLEYEENGVKKYKILGVEGGTLLSTSSFETATHFTNDTTSKVKAADLHGKTGVLEIGVLLDGVYYAYFKVVTLPPLAN